GAEPAAAADLARACAYLPLAVRITAARLVDHPHRGVAEHLAELRMHALDALRIDGDDDSSVPAAFDPSYTALEPDAQRLFRLLGLVPGPDFTAAAAAALSAMPPAAAGRLLDRLAGACLVEQHANGRYTFHDLLRDYARTRATDDDEPDTLAAGLAALLAAQRAGDPVGQAVAELTLGQALESVRDHPPAFRHFERALAYSREAGWPAGEISALKRLGLLYNATGQPDPAERHLLRAADRAARAGHLMCEVGCLVKLGTVAMHTGALRQAVRYYRRGLDLVGDPGPTVTAMALTGLGCAWSELGHHDRGIGHLTRAVALHRDTGGRHGESMAPRNLAEAHPAAGHAAQSREHAE